MRQGCPARPGRQADSGERRKGEDQVQFPLEEVVQFSVEEVRFVLFELFVELFDVDLRRDDVGGPGGAAGHSVDGVEECADALGGEGAIEGVNRAGLDGDGPFGGSQKAVDGNRIVVGAGQAWGVFGVVAQVMMGEVDGHGQGDHLVKIADLIIHDVVGPETGVDDIGGRDGGVAGADEGEVLDVMIEISGLDVVDGFGVGNMIDKVDEAGREGNLAQDPIILGDGDGNDEGQILGLEGDDLRVQLFAEPGGQGFGQLASDAEGHAEAAGVNGGRGDIGGSGQGDGQQQGAGPGLNAARLVHVVQGFQSRRSARHAGAEPSAAITVDINPAKSESKFLFCAPFLRHRLTDQPRCDGSWRRRWSGLRNSVVEAG